MPYHPHTHPHTHPHPYLDPYLYPYRSISRSTSIKITYLRHPYPYLYQYADVQTYLRHARRARTDGLRARAPPDECGGARGGAGARARGVREVGAHRADRGAPAARVTVMVIGVVRVIVVPHGHGHGHGRM